MKTENVAIVALSAVVLVLFLALYNFVQQFSALIHVSPDTCWEMLGRFVWVAGVLGVVGYFARKFPGFSLGMLWPIGVAGLVLIIVPAFNDWATHGKTDFQFAPAPRDIAWYGQWYFQWALGLAPLVIGYAPPLVRKIREGY